MARLVGNLQDDEQLEDGSAGGTSTKVGVLKTDLFEQKTRWESLTPKH